MANKKNYNKISEEAKTEPVEIEETPMVVAYVPRPTETEKVETEPVETPMVVAYVPSPTKAKFGKVTGCKKLNVRKAPNSDAPVRRVIDVNTKVEILGDFGEFYKIGDSEYCVKSFIAVD